MTVDVASDAGAGKEFKVVLADDVKHWTRHDRTKLERIKRLVAAIEVDPFTGIGKPEMLRGNLAGFVVQADQSGAPTCLSRRV